MSVSEQTREFLAEATWYFLNYPAIKAKAERIAQEIADLETKTPTKKVSIYGQDV
jgi:hypothetical protein